MKRSGVRFLIVSLLLLLFIVNVIGATEVGETRNENGNEHGPENNVKEKTKDGINTNDLKETLNGKTNETLEEGGKAKAKEKDEEGSLDGDSPVEECDPSNRCVDESSKIVACLRVPGEDSLDLSLLIQNKGKGSLDVIIIAPDSVNLEQKTVRLQPKENREVKVSVKEESGNDTTIVLKAGEGSCTLNMISNPSRKIDSSALPGRFAHLSPRVSLLFVALAVIVLLGSAWSCIRYRKMRTQAGTPTKYQPVGTGLLPISTGGKRDANEADGWDNNWEEDWGDEEAPPVTPSKLVSTPSAKGLAPRRLGKDGWKD